MRRTRGGEDARSSGEAMVDGATGLTRRSRRATEAGAATTGAEALTVTACGAGRPDVAQQSAEAARRPAAGAQQSWADGVGAEAAGRGHGHVTASTSSALRSALRSASGFRRIELIILSTRTPRQPCLRQRAAGARGPTAEATLASGARAARTRRNAAVITATSKATNPPTYA